jgi:hypothetical protein
MVDMTELIGGGIDGDWNQGVEMVKYVSTLTNGDVASCGAG